MRVEVNVCMRKVEKALFENIKDKRKLKCSFLLN